MTDRHGTEIPPTSAYVHPPPTGRSKLGTRASYTRHLPAEPLSLDEQLDLARRYHAGDVEAGERLILYNLRGAMMIASKFVRPWHSRDEIDDLYQCAAIGMHRALRLYDPEYGYPFLTYAAYWVRQTIGREWMQRLAAVSVPSNKWSAGTRVRMRRLVLLDDDDDRDKGLQTHDEQLLAAGEHVDGAAVVSDAIAEAHRRMVVDRAVAYLSDSQATVIKARWLREYRHGIRCSGFEGETLDAVAEEMGISREWVRQLEIRAIRFLHAYLSASDDGRDALSEIGIDPPEKLISGMITEQRARDYARHRAADGATGCEILGELEKERGLLPELRRRLPQVVADEIGVG